MEKLFETWSPEREIVLVKVLKHPRHKVFAAWMAPDALAQWYGTTGLAFENHEADIRAGGAWRYDMEVGSASCRERVCQIVMISVGPVSLREQVHRTG